MKKEINCTWTMGGTYYLDEKSVCAARKKALGNLPLPEDRDYLNDSLAVGDLAECMVANGWDEIEVEELSLLTPEALIRTLDERYRMGLEVIPGDPHTTTRLKAFLLDYYDIEYKIPVAEQQSDMEPAPNADDPVERMAANGWNRGVVSALSKITPEDLIQCITDLYEKGLEYAPGTSHTPVELKKFLLDYYGIEYKNPRDVEAQTEKDIPSAKECFIVVYSNSDGTDAYAFESEEGARNSIAEDVEATMQELLQQGWQPKVLTDASGNSEIYVPDTNISHEWELITSTIRA